MPVATVALFLFAVVASAAMLAFGFHLRLSHRARYLNLYFYFLVLTVSYGLVNWVGLPFYSDFSELARSSEPGSGLIIFIASALPLVLLKVYLFVAFLFALLDDRVPKIAARAFMGSGAVVLVATAYLIAKDLQGGTLEHLRPFLLLLGVLIIVVDYLAIGFYLSRTYQIEGPLQRGHARHFGWAYLLGYLAYSTPFYASYWSGGSAYVAAVPYLYYLMHFPPMVYLRRFCESREATATGLSLPPQDLGAVLKRYGISEREGAVLELVLGGRKNDEVARELCISPHTVRNHIYSIYGKMGVTNRIQLLSACSEDRSRDG
jgi:DNA-binding CsgD family transcriptional regulator